MYFGFELAGVGGNGEFLFADADYAEWCPNAISPCSPCEGAANVLRAAPSAARKDTWGFQKPILSDFVTVCGDSISRAFWAPRVKIPFFRRARFLFVPK